MKKKPYEKLNIVVEPIVFQKLEDGKYNKSKLIDSLLDIYFKNKK